MPPATTSASAATTELRRRPEQSRSTATFETLLEVAGRLLETHGFGAFTTNLLATESGVSIRAIYRYFPNKHAIVAELAGRPSVAAVGDTMWARFLVELLAHWPSGDGSSSTRYLRSTEVMNALRTRKDAAEIAALQAAGAAADRVAAQLHAGEIPLVGRTEAAVSADISARLLAEGHDVVNFAIVAAGENAASPHHHAGDRLIREGEIVLTDFGGTKDGYCSDITRCVFLGEPSAEVAEAYAVLHEAQAAGVRAGVVGAACQDVDRAARKVIADAGYGEYFIHRTGHGIGMEAHEDPYMVEGNDQPIEAGHAFSVEPGIYVAGKWGMRLEDIVVATDDGPLSMNQANHALVRIG